MKYLLLLFIIFYSFSQNTERVDFKIIVTNINTLKGNIEMGIFNNAKSFLVKGEEYRTQPTVVIVTKYALSLSRILYLSDINQI